MNKKVLKVAFVAAIALVSGINVFNAQKSEVLSDTALANVEALATVSDDWYCVGSVGECIKDSQGILYGKFYRIEEEEPED